MNLFILVGSVWLLTISQKKTIPNPDISTPLQNKPSNTKFTITFERFISLLLLGIWGNVLNYLLAILFIPTLGSLYVGQYIFPVLLGGALMIFALRRENATLIAIAAVLLTFKPHLGSPIVLAVMGYLFVKRDHFSRRALKAILVSGLFLFVSSFIADPVWPVNYLQSIFDFRVVPGVVTCELCASLPITLTRHVYGQSDLHLAMPIGVVLFALITATLFLFRRELFQSPDTLIPLAVLITLLADPYLLNYDYTLLLIPLFTLSISVRRMDWLWLAVVYLVPMLFLIIFGREGNAYYSLAAIILLAVNVFSFGKGANQGVKAK